MGFRRLVLALTLLALAGTASAQVPIADFTAHGSTYGTYNVSDPTGQDAWMAGQVGLLKLEIWADQIEDQNSIMVSWLRIEIYPDPTNPALFDIWIAPYAVSFDKITGTTGPQIDVRQGTVTTFAGQTQFSLYDMEPFRPRFDFTTAPAGAGADGAIGVYPQINLATGNTLDVHAAFFGYDPNVGQWILNFNRAEFNVSDSAGTSDCASVSALDDGDVLFGWRDWSTNGTIGSVANILPTVTFPTAAAANDVYIRRTQQRFPTIPGPGVQDMNMTTVNVSESGGFDVGVTLASDGAANAYIQYASIGVETEVVGGAANGANGPRGSVAGAETDDEYLTKFDTSLSGLVRENSVNISQSLGGGSIGGSEVAFNSDLKRVAVKYIDNSQTGGVGGLAGLNARAGAAGNEGDFFLTLLSTTLNIFGVKNLTNSPESIIVGTLQSYESGGWLTGWAVIDSGAGNVVSKHRLINGSGDPASALQDYPTAAPVSQNTQDVIYSMSGVPNQTVSIGFNCQETPLDLRTGQIGASSGDGDYFVSIGEIAGGQTAQGGLEIVNFTVNNGLPIDISALPPAVPVDISVINTHATEMLTLTSIIIDAPAAGFTLVTNLVPSLPVDLAPGELAAFVATYSVQPATLTLGTNVFSAAAVGTLQPSARAVGDNSLATIPVVGVTGNLQNVSIDVSLSRTTIPSGSATQIIMTVTIENQGPAPLTQLLFSGAMDPGLSTANGSTDFFNAVWTPVPAQTTIATASRRDFRVNLLVASDMPAGTYSPAIVVQMQQGIDALGNPVTGTITSATANPLEITSPFNAGPNGRPVPVSGFGLGNGTGTNSGCVLGESGDSNWMALVMAILALGSITLLKRNEA